MLASLGAHLASKLQHFATDERTLTDELCDMFYIWLQAGYRPPPSTRGGLIPRLPQMPLQIRISKTTQQQESVIGADLGVLLSTPQGVKQALFQAKVYDPEEGRLRCDSPEGWDRLWSQLVLMEQRAADLSFLLIYVPGKLLDGAYHGFRTWEQGFPYSGGTRTSSRFGVTLVPVTALFDAAKNWRRSPPVEHLGQGRFRPAGLSFARLFMDLLLCRRGAWEPSWTGAEEGTLRWQLDDNRYPVRYTPYRQLGVSVSTPEPDAWPQFVEQLQAAFGHVDFA